MKNFKLRIITPERVFFEDEAYMVEFNTVEGEIGVLADHVPLTTIIQPGILTIRMEDKSVEAALHDGFVEILPDSVTILAEIIEWEHEIDFERALEALERAKSRVGSSTPETDVARAHTALQRAMARMALKDNK